MKRREFLTHLGAACLLGMQIGISGCIGTGTVSSGNESQSATGTTSSNDDLPVATTNTNSNSLAGTCPKGKSCTSPQCQLWADENSNGRCDRSVQG